MKKERLLELAGIISEQGQHEQDMSDLYTHLLHAFDGVPANEIKEFLQQIAGEFNVNLNEDHTVNHRLNPAFAEEIRKAVEEGLAHDVGDQGERVGDVVTQYVLRAIANSQEPMV